MDKPDFLTLTKTIEVGLQMFEFYAADRDGNVWHSTQLGNNQSEWTLYKKASEIQFPPPSFQQVVEMRQEEGRQETNERPQRRGDRQHES